MDLQGEDTRHPVVVVVSVARHPARRLEEEDMVGRRPVDRRPVVEDLEARHLADTEVLLQEDSVVHPAIHRPVVAVAVARSTRRFL